MNDIMVGRCSQLDEVRIGTASDQHKLYDMVGRCPKLDDVRIGTASEDSSLHDQKLHAKSMPGATQTPR